MKTEDELRKAGFTDAGLRQFLAAMSAYASDLFQKATALGERDKAADTAREVTSEHVRGAVAVIASRSSEPPSTRDLVFQIGEYICAILAGVGGSRLDQKWGIALFGISLTIGVVLFVSRTSKRNGK